jgi:hypothetical protein
MQSRPRRVRKHIEAVIFRARIIVLRLMETIRGPVSPPLRLDLPRAVVLCRHNPMIITYGAGCLCRPYALLVAAAPTRSVRDISWFRDTRRLRNALCRRRLLAGAAAGTTAFQDGLCGQDVAKKFFQIETDRSDEGIILPIFNQSAADRIVHNISDLIRKRLIAADDVIVEV